MKQIISEEKSFKEFIKRLSPIRGVFGYNGYVEDGRFVKLEMKFLMFDENLKIIFEHEPYNKGGDYHKNVEAKIKEMKNENISRRDERERQRTDSTVEDMIMHLMTHHFISWSPWNSLEGEKREDYNIEPSSPEWEELNNIKNFYSNKKNILHEKCGRDSFSNRPIEYGLFTELGKKRIAESIEWFKTNKSLTPLQDAWMKVLKKDGVNVDWEPNTLALDDTLIMREIDYSTMEEIKDKREKKNEELKKSLTQGEKDTIKKIISNLNKK